MTVKFTEVERPSLYDDDPYKVDEHKCECGVLVTWHLSASEDGLDWWPCWTNGDGRLWCEDCVIRMEEQPT